MSLGTVPAGIAFGCTAAIGALSARTVGGLSPRLAARLMTACACVTALAGVVVLAMLALPLVGLDDAVADREHWSVRVLGSHRDLRAGLSVVLLLLVGRAAVFVVRRQRVHVRARRLLDEIGAAPGGLAVVADDAVDAAAVAGRAVLVTSGLMRRLPPEELRAVLAHERAHVDERHDLYVGLAHLAAALNPLLRRVPADVGYFLERSADEAAAAVTSRATVAAALRRVAADGGAAWPRAAAMSAAAVAVHRRIAALSQRSEGQRRALAVVPAVLAAAVLVAAAAVALQTWDVFRLAIESGRHVLGRG